MFDNSLNELVNWLFLIFPILRHNPTALSTGKKQKTNKKKTLSTRKPSSSIKHPKWMNSNG